MQNTPSQANDFWQVIRTVPDFPKPGIEFYDITPLFRNHVQDVIDALIDALPEQVWSDVEALAAIEARGFVLASLLAARLNMGMVLLRKEGKLPPPVTKKNYALEYGQDTLEMQANLPCARVLLVDDILATGGTLATAKQLCEEAGHKVVAALVFIDIEALHSDMGVPLYRVLTA